MKTKQHLLCTFIHMSCHHSDSTCQMEIFLTFQNKMSFIFNHINIYKFYTSTDLPDFGMYRAIIPWLPSVSITFYFQWVPQTPRTTGTQRYCFLRMIYVFFFLFDKCHMGLGENYKVKKCNLDNLGGLSMEEHAPFPVNPQMIGSTIWPSLL